MYSKYGLILGLLLVMMIATSCRTPMGTVDLSKEGEGKGKAEKVDYVFPLTNWVMWTKYTLIEGSFASTIRFMRKVGHWFIVGGLLAIVIAAAVHIGFSNLLTRSACLATIAGGVLAALLGIVSCLMANPWILGAVLVIFIGGLAALGHYLWKTRKYSILKGAKAEAEPSPPTD